MKHKLYRRLESGERIQDGDFFWRHSIEDWSYASPSQVGSPGDGDWLRPVSIERVTGTESAFPAFDGSGAVGGMTLREHYAGLAMQGLLSYQADGSFYSAHLPHEGALVALEWADALIAVLNKKEEGV